MGGLANGIAVGTETGIGKAPFKLRTNDCTVEFEAMLVIETNDVSARHTLWFKCIRYAVDTHVSAPDFKDAMRCCDHEQHIRAASCRSHLESEWENPTSPPPVEPKLVGDRAENW